MKPKDLYPPNTGIWKTTRKINCVLAKPTLFNYQDIQKVFQYNTK